MRRKIAWPAALALIGAAALILRLLTVFELRGSPLFSVLIGDSVMFDALARGFLAGQWLGDSRFYEPPLYPYVVAAVYSVGGPDPFAVRVVQACLGAVSCVLVAVAGRRFFDERAGIGAGALLAIYPAAIFFDALVHKASVDALLMSLLLVLLARVNERPRWHGLLLAGLVTGALAWNRENARLVIPVLAAWLLLPRLGPVPLGKRLQWAVLFVAGAALLLAPVTLRNIRASGEALMTSSQFGPNFYIGNHAGASGGYEPLVPGRGMILYEREDAARVAQQAAGRALRPSEVSGYWFERARADIKAAPGAWLALMARKAWLTIAATEPVDTESLEAYGRFSRTLATLRPFTFGVLLALAVFGAWMSRGAWRQHLVLYVLFAVTAGSVVVFFVFARYRFPLVPIAALFAGAAVAAVRRIPSLPLAQWLPGLVAAVIAAAVLHIPVRTSSDETLVNYGSELLRQGRAGEAVPLLQHAVADDPQHVQARLNLALALQRTAQPYAAMEQLRESLRLDPSSVEAHGGLAMALHQEGKTTEAIAAYRQALALAPGSVELTSNLGLALLASGDAKGAILAFERAVVLQPQNVALHMNLCSAIGEVRPATAIACFERALALARNAGDTSAVTSIEQALQALRSARAP